MVALLEKPVALCKAEYTMQRKCYMIWGKGGLGMGLRVNECSVPVLEPLTLEERNRDKQLNVEKLKGT